MQNDSGSDQEDFESVKPKKRGPGPSDGASANKGDDAAAQKKRRRAIIDSDEDE